jgi:chromosomal replication initiation ATPase DnaA
MTALDRASLRLARASADLAAAREEVRRLTPEPVLPHQRPEIAAIRKTVAEYYQIEPEEIISRSRREPVATARLVALILCRKLTGMGVAELGRAFGRNHAMVGYAAGVIRDRCATSLNFRAEWELLHHAARLAVDRVRAARAPAPQPSTLSPQLSSPASP